MNAIAMTRLSLITLLLLIWTAGGAAAQDPTSRHMPFAGIATTLASGTPVDVQIELLDENQAVVFSETRTVTPYGGGSGVVADPAAGGAIDFLFGDQTPGGLNPAHFPAGSSRYVDVKRLGTSVLRFGRLALFGTPFALSSSGGGGTVTQVDSGFALTGGPITQTGTLSLDTTVTDGRYARLGETVTRVDSGTGLTGGPITSTGTLSLDTPFTDGRYAQLGASNNFTGNQSINGLLNVNGTATAQAINTATEYQAGGNRVLGVSGKGNLYLGILAGPPKPTTGDLNTFLGMSAGANNGTGSNNTFVGHAAGQMNSGGARNAFFGYGAGATNATGINNAFFGAEAGKSNTASSNAFFGASAGSSNSSGSSNAFFGHLAGTANVTGNNNAFFGAEAGKSNTASSNAFFGASAGSSNSSGSSNAFFGHLAGTANVSGISNAFFGALAGSNNTTGGANAFFGYLAGTANVDGNNNAFFGVEAGKSNTTGFQNVFIGGFAGFENTAGFRNTYVGISARGLPDLINATAIGAFARVERSNSVVLGNAANVGIATVAPANILTIGQNSPTDPIADAWTTYSSRRWKTNIHTIDGALEKVERLRGVTFDWQADGKRDLGFIAEEVGAVLPELVAYEDNGTDAKSLDYARLTALLVEAIKEQQRQIEALRAELHRRNTRR
jgi:hypothetical protein